MKNHKRLIEKRKLSSKISDNTPNKIKKLDELSKISEELDSMELNSSREDCVPDYIPPDMWKPELELTNDDKTLLFNVLGKLNSNHMEAVNKLSRKQVGKNIGSLQLTEREQLTEPVFK
jgi:hypothetical protein